MRNLAWLVLAIVLFPQAAQADILAKGSYANTVLAARTTTGEEVLLTAGRHKNFPFQGADWDNVVLKIGMAVYHFTKAPDSPPRPSRLSVRVSGNRTAWISYTGKMQAYMLGFPPGPRDPMFPAVVREVQVNFAFRCGASSVLPCRVPRSLRVASHSTRAGSGA